jgi:hypothetical protein
MPDNTDTIHIEEIASYTPEELKAEANRIVKVTAQRHQLSPDDLSPEMLESAVSQARKNLSSTHGSAYKAMYEQQKIELEAAQRQLREIKQQSVSSATANDQAKSIKTAEVSRAQMGNLAWNRLSIDGRLRSINIEPNEIDVELAKKMFGKGADSSLANSLMKTDPLKYKKHREASLILDLMGK